MTSKKNITFYCTEELAAKIEKAASEEELTVSAYLRRLLNKVFKEKEKEAKKMSLIESQLRWPQL